jgi:hypothetical protein
LELLTGSEETLFRESVAEDGESNVTQGTEHDDQGEVDLERIEIVVIKVAIEPADKEVVCKSQDPRCADCVVCPDICHNGDLGGKTNIRGEELSEERSKRTASKPESEWMEQQFVAAVSVLLPAIQFVVHCQGNTFFEAIAGIGAKTNDVTGNLETQRHIEVLRDVRLRPELFVSIFVIVGHFLQGRPTENSIVANKRRDVTIGNRVADGRIDKVGEEGNSGRTSVDVLKLCSCPRLPVFEKAICNLHDA